MEPTNRKPVGNADHFGVVEGTSLVVNYSRFIVQQYDPDGDGIIISNYFAPSHGTLTSIVTNGSFTYVPEPGFTETDDCQ